MLTMTSMKRIMSQVNPAIPRSKLVSVGAAPSFSEMDPKWVRVPVLTTMALAEPLTTLLPWKTAFGISITALDGSLGVSACFSTGIASPVSEDWLTKKSFAVRRRRSAGMMEPA